MVTMVTPYLITSYTKAIPMGTSECIVRQHEPLWIVVHEAEEGGYWGEVLGLPGCVSQGETIDEFRHNIEEALEAVLESKSQGPRIEIYTEPTLKVSDTWTATE